MSNKDLIADKSAKGQDNVLNFDATITSVTRHQSPMWLLNHSEQKAPINFKFIVQTTLISNLEAGAVKTFRFRGWGVPGFMGVISI